MQRSRHFALARALFASLIVSSLASVARATTEVSNLGSSVDNGATLNFNFSERAGAFTTGSTAASWTLASMTAHLFGAGNGSDGVAQMALYTNNFGQPGTLIETLAGNPIPTFGGDFTFTSAGTTLAPNTTYWFVLSKPTGSTLLNWGITSNFAETSPDGWTIANQFDFSEDAGASWGANGGFAAIFSVDVVPEPASLALLAIGGLSLMRRRRA